MLQNPNEEKFPGFNVIIPLNHWPSGVSMDEMLKSNESVKEAIFEGSNTNADALKLIKGKDDLKDEMNVKDPHRITRRFRFLK